METSFAGHCLGISLWRIHFLLGAVCCSYDVGITVLLDDCCYMSVITRFGQQKCGNKKSHSIPALRQEQYH
ncbi:hypothetical protein GGI43DRAFT_76555 [Trichoderma evansii]